MLLLMIFHLYLPTGVIWNSVYYSLQKYNLRARKWLITEIMTKSLGSDPRVKQDLGCENSSSSNDKQLGVDVVDLARHEIFDDGKLDLVSRFSDAQLDALPHWL